MLLLAQDEYTCDAFFYRCHSDYSPKDAFMQYFYAMADFQQHNFPNLVNKAPLSVMSE